MPSYPAFAHCEGSREQLLDGRELVRATNGAPKVRLLAAALKRSWVVEHLLSAADYAALLAFYGANQDGSFDFEWESATYTALFGAPAIEPQWTEYGYRVTVRLEEV